VAFIREPALAIWQATKCLAEIHARTDAPEVSKIVAEAELILLGLMLALVRRSVSGSAAALATPIALRYRTSRHDDGNDR
jgi:hypothetical protein